MKGCEVCGEQLEGKRRDAVYCSGACKQYAHRRRRKAPSVAGTATVSDGARLSLAVPVPAVITIREPGRPRPEQPEGPPSAPLVA
jgi:hypothetical protein